MAYTPFDSIESYTFAGTTNLQPFTGTRFEYDGDQHRILKTLVNSDAGALEETVYLDDLYERVRTDGNTHRFYVAAGSAMVVLTRAAGAGNQVAYALTDALGSVDAITDGGGKVIEKRSYDAFGARRNPVGWGPWQGALTSNVTPVGFEGLEADDEVGLVNMRGRIYDPKIGRFLTTDPLVSRPGFAQSWNPYSYVLNSPLNFTDPSGFQDTPAGLPLLPPQPMPGCGSTMSCTVVKAEPPRLVNACTVTAVTVARDGARDDAPAKTVTAKSDPAVVEGPTIGAAPQQPTTDPRYPDPKYRYFERAAAAPASPVVIVSPQGVVGVVPPGSTAESTWRDETFPEYPGYSISVKEPDTKNVETFASVAMVVVPGGVGTLAAWGAEAAIAGEPALAKAAQSVTTLESSAIRFSQSSVNGVAEIAESMAAKGWAGPPIDVVQMGDGIVTVDNTRLLASHMTSTPVQAIVHGAEEALPESMSGRFGSAKTWGEAVQYRIANQNAAYRSRFPGGSVAVGVGKP